MFMKFSCRVWLLLPGLCAFSYSQSLDSLLIEAAQKNPKLLAWNEQIKAATYRIDAARSLPPPTLSLEFSQIPWRESDLVNGGLANNVSLSQMFHLGGKLKAMSDAERAGVQSMQQGREEERQMLLYDIRMNYYQIWLLDRKIELQHKTIDLLQLALASWQQKLMTGSNSQASVYLLQAEQAGAQAQIIKLTQQRAESAFTLNALLGRQDVTTAVDPVKQLAIDSTFRSYIVDTTLTLQTPMLRRMQSMITMNQTMAQAVHKERIPDMMLQAMIMRMPRGMILTSQTPMMMDEKIPSYMYSIMVSFTLPFLPWSAPKYRARAQELQSLNGSLELLQKSMLQSVDRQTKTAQAKKHAAWEMYRIYREQALPNLERAVQSQLSELQNNQLSLTVLLQTVRMAVMEEMNLYMAITDYHMAEAELTRLTAVQ